MEPQHSGLIPQPSALVGRDADLAYLHERLEKTLRGERQQVFVTGEPGIGKTTLLEAFRQELETRDWGLAPAPQASSLKPLASGVWLGWGQCIEQHGAGEAFLPILDALGRLCRRLEGEQVIEILRKHAPMWLAQLPAFVEREELEALQWKVQGASRERMLREMAEALEVLTTDRPLVLVLEDLHWSDISTLALLAFIARRKESARLMIVGSYRPVEMLREGHPLKGVTQELYGHQLATELSLGVLSEANVQAYLATRFSFPSPLKGEGQGESNERIAHLNLVRTLHQRTGGNPLFLVSLVNDLVARGALRQTEEGWSLQGEVDTVSIPDTIRQLVARQRERLQPEERRLLEAASAARLEFSAAAVAAALGMETTIVEQHCERLAEQQQFLRRAGVMEWPDGTLAARYSFLHALYQQLWHEQVSPTQLQHYHLQIGQRKEQAYGERAREIAGELAVHFEQGRDYRRAVQYLGRAGWTALSRSANQEAIHLVTKGLVLLQTLPDTRERIQVEVTLQLILLTPLMVMRGLASPEMEKVLARVRELSQQVGNTPQLFRILYGLAVFYVERAELHTARELVEQVFALAQGTQDFLLRLKSRFAMAGTLLVRGEITEAQEHAKWGIGLYNCYKSQRSAWEAHHNGVGCFNCLAWSLWFLGYPDQALRRTQEALTMARAMGLPSTLAETLSYAAWFYLNRREWQVAEEHAATLVKLCREQEFPFWQAEGTIVWGGALAEQARDDEGMIQIRQGLADYRATGAELRLPDSLALLATVYRKRGQTEVGLQVVTEALARVGHTGGRLGEAELYRLKGELTLQLKAESHKSKVEEAAACFLKAIDIAREQQAKMWELRATLSLARLWRQQGKKDEARQMLAEIYSWFTEGFDTKDLREAKALLGELGQ